MLQLRQGAASAQHRTVASGFCILVCWLMKLDKLIQKRKVMEFVHMADGGGLGFVHGGSVGF
jgi:hypothetical protein